MHRVIQEVRKVEKLLTNKIAVLFKWNLFVPAFVDLHFVYPFNNEK